MFYVETERPRQQKLVSLSGIYFCYLLMFKGLPDCEQCNVGIQIPTDMPLVKPKKHVKVKSTPHNNSSTKI